MTQATETTVVETKNITSQIKKLHELCLASEKRLFNASEHVRNRGLKLVLKTFVEQRARMAQELQRQLEQIAEPQNEGTDVTGSLGRGWTDIKATMTVQRSGRQQLVLEEAAEAEQPLLQTYQETLAQPLPANLKALLAGQESALRDSHRVMLQLSERTNQQLLVRLFNNKGRADTALDQLRQAGFAENDIYVAPISEAARFLGEAKEQKRSLREVAVTSTFLGLLAGSGLGLLLAIAHMLYFPEVDGLIASTPMGTFIEIVAAGAVLGALFGTIFGLFMGYDAAEDDEFLYYESLEDGSVLVAVSTDRAKSSLAEQIIGLKHQFEVRPVGASA